jgi:uroporphyrinogen decarboxylase
MMRQAGRTLPEYRALRAEHDFLEVMRSPELATEVTLQPVRRFGVDAAVVFSDILTVPEAMGQALSFGKGMGPKLAPTLEEGFAPRVMDPARDLPFLGETLDRLRAALGDDTAIVGFAGAPFTLLSYMCAKIDKEASNGAKRLMLTEPARGHAILSMLADAVSALMLYQLEHDADAVQLFDTWAGSLSAEDHAAWSQPYNRIIAERVAAAGGKMILYAKDAPHLTEALIHTGAAGLSVDWRTDLPTLARRLDGDGSARVALQGNLDPACLYGPPDAIAARVRDLHARMGGRPGHVFNLGHGLLPTTPVDGIAAFVEAVQGLGGAA